MSKLPNAERRSAGELDGEVRAPGFGIDQGFAALDAGGRVHGAGECGERALLGDRPRGLPEDLAFREAPVAGEPGDQGGPHGHVGRGGTGHLDAHGGDARRGADIHLERDRHRIRAAIDADIDHGREIACGGGGVARFVDRLQRQAIEEFDRHFRIVLPAHEADIALQRFLERRRRDDLDAVGKRRWRAGGLGWRRQRRGFGRDRFSRERARKGEREREQPGGRRLQEGCARHRPDYPRLRIRVGPIRARAVPRLAHHCSAIRVRRRAAAARGAGSRADPELRAAAGRDSSSHPADRRIPTARYRCA